MVPNMVFYFIIFYYYYYIYIVFYFILLYYAHAMQACTLARERQLNQSSLLVEPLRVPPLLLCYAFHITLHVSIPGDPETFDTRFQSKKHGSAVWHVYGTKGSCGASLLTGH